MSLKPYIDWDEILQKDTRHIELHDDGFQLIMEYVISDGQNY
jgi:hypothetical protein